MHASSPAGASCSLSLPSDAFSHPVRYLYGTGVSPPTDPEQILTDRIEQWCAKQQAEHQIADSRLIDLRVQTLQDLDRAVLALQLLTQSNWGPGQNYRFLNVRAAAMDKDSVYVASLSPVLAALLLAADDKAAVCQASLRRSSTFAAVLSQLRTLWSIEDRDNRVIVDLLPLSSLVRSESPYFCSLTARLEEGVCVVTNPEISDILQHRKRLRITTRGVACRDLPLACAVAPVAVLEGRAGQIDLVLREFQEICLDHAIYAALLDAAKTYRHVDRSQWVASVRPGDFVQFVCLSDPQNIRTIKAELVSTDPRPAAALTNSVEAGLRRRFLESRGEGGAAAQWLLGQ